MSFKPKPRTWLKSKLSNIRIAWIGWGWEGQRVLKCAWWAQLRFFSSFPKYATKLSQATPSFEFKVGSIVKLNQQLQAWYMLDLVWAWIHQLCHSKTISSNWNFRPESGLREEPKAETQKVLVRFLSDKTHNH